MEIHSTAFSPGGAIPVRFTADGDDISPAISWQSLPAGTKELALIVDDPDAPTPKPWVHWVIYKIPATANGLPEKISASATFAKTLQGKNSWNTIGYRGPQPPRGHGVHHYHFKLYALGSELTAQAGLDKDGLLKLLSGHTLTSAELIGTYQR